MSVAYTVDPQLPPIPATDIACPGCRQTLETIRDGGRRLPDWHYPHPTHVQKWGITVATDKGGRNMDRLCPVDGDTLNALIFIEQRNRAALKAAS